MAFSQFLESNNGSSSQFSILISSNDLSISSENSFISTYIYHLIYIIYSILFVLKMLQY
jgi:hypothetical protein